jgi:EmrB/QacA subfamily drug resistance transporter
LYILFWFAVTSNMALNQLKARACMSFREAGSGSTSVAVASIENSLLDSRRWRALPVLLIGSFLAFLDTFIVNIALPSIQADLKASPAELQFIVAAYGIGFGVFLITGGRLGDIFGRKRVFLLGITGFTLASLLCGLAPTPTALIVFRAVQAICAATVTPQVLAIIRVEFADTERPVAIGLYGGSMGLAAIVAQLLGGWLVSLDLFGWSWRPIFLLNIPISLIAVVLATRMVRESKAPRGATLDLGGVALMSLTLFLLLYPIVEGREAGWPQWSFLMLAAVPPILVGFIFHQRHVVRRQRTPLIALHLLRVPTLRFGLAVSAVFFGSVGAFFFVVTVFLQVGLRYAPFAAGLMFLPFAVGFLASSLVSGPIANRIGPRIINLGTGMMVVSLTGVIVITRFASASLDPAGIDGRLFLPVFLLYGLGQGLTQPSLINTVSGSAGITGKDAGSAAGLFLTTAQSLSPSVLP